MKTHRLPTIAAALVAAAPWTGHAGELDLTGFVGLSNRSFWEDEAFATQSRHDASVELQSEVYWRSESDRSRISVVAFGRHDTEDDERSHLDLREAYWGYEGDGWDIKLGVGKVFWGVAESRHLVDVINQTDLVEDIDQEAKLGQPMANLNIQRDFGRFELYYLPAFRERTFPGEDGRFRLDLPVDSDAAIYEAREGDDHDDFAVRWSHYFGDVDMGVHVFDGTSREPRFVVAPEGDRLLPVYDQMTQIGIDVQYTRGPWLLKLEAIGRETGEDQFAAQVGGVEFTFFGARGSSADVGVLFEYLRDDRGSGAPPTAFDNDIFAGTRLALNDSSDTSLLAGVVIDLDTHARFLNFEAERRFGERFVAELRLRAFSNVDRRNALAAFAEDDYVQLGVSWYY
jgi:hypothetical protein